MKKYGIAVNTKDDRGTLVAYVPLNVVNDPIGGAPVAFSGRMLYRPNSSNFGKTQDVRLIWLVQTITDQCTQVPDEYMEGEDDTVRYDTWCEDNNNWQSSTSVVHTYYDDWYLTGLSVKEDHGGKMAALYQRSANSTGYDNYLWTAAIGLEKSFIAGRADMTIEEIQRRFDYGSNGNASYTERWSIPRTALDMRVETIQDETDQAKFPTEYTQEILTESFGSRSSATILFLGDSEARFATLDMGTDIIQSPDATIRRGLIDNSSITVNLDPKYISTEPDLQMNWASFRKSGDSWEAYSLSEYSKEMQDTFVSLLRNDDNDSDITAGKALYLRSFYLSLSIGAQYSPFVLPKTDSDLKNLLKSRDAARILLNAFEPTHGTASSAFKRIGAMRDSGEENSSDAGSSESAPLQGISLSGGLANGTNTALNTYVLTMKNSGNGGTKEENIQWEVAGAKTVIGVSGIAGAMGDAAKIAKLSKDVSKATRTANTARRGGLMLTSYTAVGKVAYGDKIAKVQKINKAAKKMAVVGLVIGIGIAAGVFFYQWASGAIEPGTPQFKQAMAMMIAQIIVAVVLFLIEFFVPGGAIIVAVISLIDGLIMGICKAVGASSKDSFICDGIVMSVTKFIASLIYEYTPLVDMNNQDRLSVGALDNTLTDPEKGFVVGNSIKYSTKVKSTLYRKAGGLDDILKTTMRYELTKKKEKGDQRIHKRRKLDTNQMASEWIVPNKNEVNTYLGFGQNITTYIFDNPYIEVEPSQTFTFNEAGLNKPEKGSSFYLAEGHATLAEEYEWGNTWGFLPGTEIVKAPPDSSYFSMGPSVVYDIFPATLDSFYDLTERRGGYALSWDSRFSTLADADGDGLRSVAFDGNDPDDSNPDIDGDGLTDFYEIQNASHGFDPRKKDTDGDGLSDYEEVIHKTEPNKADSDYDGLLDKFEVEGWSFVYGFDSNDQPLQTIATANPFDNDTDDDTLTDYREMVFGTNPRVWSDPEIVKMTSEIDDKDGYVRPSQKINYTAHIENKLLNRDIRGLLEVEFPAGVQDVSMQAKPFTLGPQKETTLKGSMKVSPDAQTQELNIINRASSHIPNPQSNYVRPENKSRDTYVVRFDEPPGADAFTVGLQDRNSSLTLSGSGEVDSGLPGVYNQAIRLRKTSSVSSLSIWSLKSFGVWVNPGDAQGADDSIIVDFMSGYYSSKYSLHYDAQKQQVYLNHPNGNTYNSTTVRPGEWSFISISFGSSSSISVNGNSQSYRGSTYSSLKLYIGSIWKAYPSFVGLVDHLTVRESHSEAGMMREAPVVTLHLDEAAGAKTFANTNRTVTTDAYCEGEKEYGDKYCPTAGTRGQVRNAVVFDGNDHLTIDNSDFFNQGYLGVSLWVKPSEDTDRDQILVENKKGTTRWEWVDGGFKLYLDGDLKPSWEAYASKACDMGYGTYRVKANSAIPLNEWTHLTAVHHPTEGSILYINGALAAQDKPKATQQGTICPTNNPVRIGATTWGKIGYKQDHFIGALDEISIFSEQLLSKGSWFDKPEVADVLPSESEIRQTFNYQGAWFDASSEHKVIIDADNPTVELDLAETHLAKRDVVLPIVAQDETSGVIGVIYQINDGPWQLPHFDKGVWTFTYSPSEVGEQTISVFTMDRVGNTALSKKTIIIEETPPVVTLNGAGERTPQPLIPEEDTISWAATLSGKATESSEHDSGVDHLTVSVFDKYGGYIGKPKTVTSFGDDGQWSVDYSLGLKPDGFYPVQIEAVDKVGNRSTTDFTIALESSPPTADLLNTTPFVDEEGTAHPDVMAGTTDTGQRPTVAGTMSDIPSFPNALLIMHVDEPAGATTFADSSDSRLTATCSGDACPQAAIDGLYGYGVAFDGNDALTLTEGPTYRRTETLRESNPDAYVAAAPLPIQKMSIAARVYVDEQHNMDGFVSAMQSVNGAEGGWMLGSRNGRFVFGLATADADDGDGFMTYLEARETYTTGQWYTVIGTYDGTMMRIYVDGEFQASSDVQSGPILYPDSAWYGIGSYRDGDETYPFTGRLDEIALYDYVLSSDDITTMFAPTSGVGTLEVALQHKRDEMAGTPPSWLNIPLASDQIGQPYTQWSYQLPEGLEGIYRISLRVTDASGNTTIIPNVWEGMIDTHAPRLNLSPVNTNKGVQYTTTVEDFNIQQEGFSSPCGIDVVTQQDNYTEMWYQETYKSVDVDGNSVPAPDRPYRLTARCVLPGKIGYEEQSTLEGHSLELIGDVAYILPGDGVRSVDMSDPSSPKEIYHRKSKTLRYAHSYRVDDATGRALLLADAGKYSYLLRQDVSNPKRIKDTGYDRYRDFKDLAIQGDYGYTTHSYISHGLDIYDITSRNPKSVGIYYHTYYKPYMERGDVTFMTIEAITEKYLFLNQGDSMLVLDISSSPDLKKVADVEKPADTYVVEGDYLYAVSQWGFSIYDISTIESIPIPPKPNCEKFFDGYSCDWVTRESLPYVGGYSIKALDVAVQGNMAYVVAKDESSWSTQYSVYVFDITDKSNPVLSSTYTAPAGEEITDIETSSKALYIEVEDSWKKKMQRVLTLKGDDLLKADACDIYGNCTDFSRGTQTYEAQGINFSTAVDLPQTTSSPPSVAPVEVSVGPLPSMLSEPEPITISLSLTADAGMKDLTVTMESQTLATQSWSQADAVTRTFVSVPWTPPAEGSYSLVVEATDHAGNTDRDDETTILLDTQPPQVGVHQSSLGLHQYDTAQDEFVLTGEVIDDASLAYLDVVLTMGDTGGTGNTVETLPVAVRDPGGNPLSLPATFPSGSAIYATMQWEARWTLTNVIPSGLNATIVVTATDLAGRESVVEQPLLIDGVAPSNVDMTLSYNADGDTTTIITPGMTLSEVRDPEMVISWEPAEDATGIKQYLVGWTTSPEVNLSELVSYDPTSTSHTQQVGDAQRWYAHVVAEDQAGNRTTTTRGPIYVDYATTPTYISMEENGTIPYRSWAESSCSMVGVDNRIYTRKNNLASLDDGQRFYATWNHDGLRMMWTGARWETDGDLFIYLDTKEGGSSQLYDPYPATITNTVILLPPRNDMASLAAVQSAEAVSPQATSPRPVVRPRLSATSGAMAADTLIWVQSDDTATLLQWDGSAWQTVADGLSYYFDQNLPTPTTDLYVPFSTLGISEPASTTLSLLAVASEEDALRLWATMPPRNNLNSERIVESTGASEFQQFALTKSYSWQLADGMCPGVVSDTPGTSQGATVQQDATEGTPTGADMSVSISSYPSGVAYSLLNDNLFFAMKDLPQFAGIDWGGVGNVEATFCANNPDDPSCERDTAAKPTLQGGDTSGVRLESLIPIGGGVDFNVQEELNATMSVDTPPLGNGNPVVYTIELQNTGTVASRDVVVDIYTWGPIRLPGGEYRTDAAGEYDYQSLQVGDIAAGERRAISFPAIVDTTFDRQNQHGKATIDVTVYDATGSHQHLDDGSDIYTNELEWLYVDHEVDTSPPDYIEIQSPRGLLTRGKNVVSGFVYDRSPVPQVEVEVLLPDGSSRVLTCEDSTPDDGQWECVFDASTLGDGAQVQMRARATDTTAQPVRGAGGCPSSLIRLHRPSSLMPPAKRY